MFAVKHLLLVMFLFGFNQVALAHASHHSILYAMFGENFTHWLIQHQGWLIVGAIFIVSLFVFYRFFTPASQSNR